MRRHRPPTFLDGRDSPDRVHAATFWLSRTCHAAGRY
jgi:hypothetical protein